MAVGAGVLRRRTGESRTDQTDGPGAATRSTFHVLRFTLLTAVIAILLYIVVFATLSLRRHDALQSNAFDLAIFDQAIWNTAQGRPYEVSIKIDDLNGTTLLGDHFSPLLAVLAPLYWIVNDVQALLAAQTLLLALGAVPIALTARRQIRNRLAPGVLTVAYLLSPALQFTNLYDFHEIALAVPALAFAGSALIERRYRALTIWLVIAALCKEEFAFVVAGFGLVLVLSGGIRATGRQKGWRREVGTGLAILVGGLLWATIVIGYLIPALEGAGNYTYVSRYGDLGDSPAAIAISLLTRPFDIAGRLFSAAKVEFVVSFLAPFALFPLLAPDLALLAAPTFGYLLVSAYPAQYTIGRQYGVVLVPLLAIAAIVAWRRVEGSAGSDRSTFNLQLSVGMAVAMLISAIGTYLIVGPGPLGGRYDAARYTPTPRIETARQIMAQIPPDASVSAQENLAPHLAHRRALFLYPSLHGADWIMLDNDGGTYPVDRATWDRETGDLVANPLYRLVENREGFALFQRQAGLPGIPTSVRFGDHLRLAAYDTRRESDSVELGLYWEVLQRQGPDAADGYRQTVQLLDESGRAVATIGRPPRPGSGYFETGRGVVHALIRERFRFDRIAAGSYRLDVEVGPEGSGSPFPITGTTPVITLP